jgi:hypothetical protein
MFTDLNLKYIEREINLQVQDLKTRETTKNVIRMFYELLMYLTDLPVIVIHLGAFRLRTSRFSEIPKTIADHMHCI